MRGTTKSQSRASVLAEDEDNGLVESEDSKNDGEFKDEDGEDEEEAEEEEEADDEENDEDMEDNDLRNEVSFDEQFNNWMGAYRNS
jgi:hypothetical protein